MRRPQLARLAITILFLGLMVPLTSGCSQGVSPQAEDQSAVEGSASQSSESTGGQAEMASPASDEELSNVEKDLDESLRDLDQSLQELENTAGDSQDTVPDL